MLSILIAYILADIFSGIYHYLTDKGYNFKNQVEMFQEHHNTNTMQDFDWQTFAGSMPILIIGGWLHSVFLIFLGVFVALTQVTHYYAHRKSKSPLIYHLVRVLQITKLIVSPTTHQQHHKQPHNKNFCLLSGWNNFWMNKILP